MTSVSETDSDRSSLSPDLPAPEFLAPKDASQLSHQIQRQARNGGKLIAFISPTGGEGTSSMARDFALLAARRSDGPVLLLDFDLPANRHLNWLGQRATLLSNPASFDMQWGELKLHRLGSSNLLVSELVPRHPDVEPSAASLIESGLLDRFRNLFGTVIIDVPPLALSFEGVALGGMADATIMVVEAERTRAPAAINLSERLTAAGAQLIGFVFNKRRYYVPEFLNRRI